MILQRMICDLDSISVLQDTTRKTNKHSYSISWNYNSGSLHIQFADYLKSIAMIYYCQSEIFLLELVTTFTPHIKLNNIMNKSLILVIHVFYFFTYHLSLVLFYCIHLWDMCDWSVWSSTSILFCSYIIVIAFLIVPSHHISVRLLTFGIS